MTDTDPTMIFTKNDSGEWINPDDKPYHIHPNDASVMTYGQMRELSMEIGKIFHKVSHRQVLKAEVRARF